MKFTRRTLELSVFVVGLLTTACNKPAPSSEQAPAVETAVELAPPTVWPATGARLLVYDVEKNDIAKGGGVQKFERAKSITVDPAKPGVVEVATTDDYQPVMTEYFLVNGDEVSWTAFRPKGVSARKMELEPPLLLFKKSFQGGEVAGANSPVEITVIGWEELLLSGEKIRACKIRISFVSEKSEKFTGFHRTIWFHDQLGPVKEEKILYKNGEIIQKENAVLRSHE